MFLSGPRNHQAVPSYAVPDTAILFAPALLPSIGPYLQIAGILNDLLRPRKLGETEDLGFFPEYLPLVGKHLINSHGPIRIAVDAPDLGFIWAPSYHRRFRSTIRQLASKRQVELLLPDDISLITASSGYQNFGNLDQFKNTPSWKNFLSEHPAFGKFGSKAELDPQLRNSIWNDIDLFHRSGVDIRFQTPTSDEMVRFLFLADDVAIFSPSWRGRVSPAPATASWASKDIEIYQEIYRDYASGSRRYPAFGRESVLRW